MLVIDANATVSYRESVPHSCRNDRCLLQSLAGLRECIASTRLWNFPNAYVYGDPTERLPGHLSLGLRGNEVELGKLLTALDQAGVAASAGSACGAHHAAKPWGVLLAMGYDERQARGASSA